MKKLQIIVKKKPNQSIDDIVFEISQISGVDLKEKPEWFVLSVDEFWIWKNVLWDVDSVDIVTFKSTLMQILDISITEMPTTWWGRNGEKAFVTMGLTSIAGFIVGMLSWVTHPP